MGEEGPFTWSEITTKPTAPQKLAVNIKLSVYSTIMNAKGNISRNEAGGLRQNCVCATCPRHDVEAVAGLWDPSTDPR